jgi:hypothetical protein
MVSPVSTDKEVPEQLDPERNVKTKAGLTGTTSTMAEKPGPYLTNGMS